MRSHSQVAAAGQFQRPPDATNEPASVWPILTLPESSWRHGNGLVSVIMPAYNEADVIRESISSVKKCFQSFCPNHEIIVVDDGSVDETRRRASETGEKLVKVVGYNANQGKGHALKVGSRVATGDLTFLIDSDSEIWPGDLQDYLSALDNADIVIGSKRHPRSIVHAPVPRKFLSIAFNLIERILVGVRATDTQAGLKAARTSALNRIMPLLSVKRYAFDAELLAIATLLNLKILELPVQVNLKASFRTKEVFRMLIDILGIAYRLRIRRWYQKELTLPARSF